MMANLMRTTLISSIEEKVLALIVLFKCAWKRELPIKFLLPFPASARMLLRKIYAKQMNFILASAPALSKILNRLLQKAEF